MIKKVIISAFGLLTLFLVLAIAHSITTFGWKTYSHPELGYSFRHPWTIRVNYDSYYGAILWRHGSSVSNALRIKTTTKDDFPNYIAESEYAITAKKIINGNNVYIIDKYVGEYTVMLDTKETVYSIYAFINYFPTFFEKREAELIASTIKATPSINN